MSNAPTFPWTDEDHAAAAERERQDFITGLRELADFLAANPSAPYPSYGIACLTHLNTDGEKEIAETKERLATIVRESGGEWRKAYFGNSFEISKEFTGDVIYSVTANREAVCEKKVVGTKTVMRKDPEALRNIPEVPVEEEIVEWECGSLFRS